MPLAAPQTPSTWRGVPAKGYLDLQAGVGEGGHRVLGAGHGGHHAGGLPGPQEGQQHRLLSVQRRAPGGCGDTAPRLGGGGHRGAPGGASAPLPTPGGCPEDGGGAVPRRWTALSSSRLGSGGSVESSVGSSPLLASRTQALMRCRSRLSLPLRAYGRAP